MEHQIAALVLIAFTIAYIIVSVNSHLWKGMSNYTKTVHIVTQVIIVLMTLDAGFFNYILPNPANVSKEIKSMADILFIPSGVGFFLSSAAWLYIERLKQEYAQNNE